MSSPDFARNVALSTTRVEISPSYSKYFSLSFLTKEHTFSVFSSDLDQIRGGNNFIYIGERMWWNFTVKIQIKFKYNTCN